MKRTSLLLLIAVMALCLLVAASPAFASVSEKRNKRVLKVTSTDTRTINSTHRVVGGSSLYNTGNSFYNKYIGPTNRGAGHDYIGGGSALTSAELAYLRTVVPAGYNRVNHLVDLTGHTIVTDYNCAFSGGSGWHDIYGSFNRSFSGGSRTYTNSTYESEMLDPYTEIIYENKVITTENINYQMVAYYCESPIILDLDGNTDVDTAKKIWLPHDPKFFKHNAKFFDIDGDGNADYTEWMNANPNDGLLVLPDENGRVNTALELFGTAGGYRDGYEKLSIICDTDKNGWVEGAELKGLKLWIDKNNNAVCEESELKELSDYGIAKISTNHKDFVSSYVTTDGKVRYTWDWWPTMATTRKFRREK